MRLYNATSEALDLRSLFTDLWQKSKEDILEQRAAPL